jgi:hypothetical protein
MRIRLDGIVPQSITIAEPYDGLSGVPHGLP